MLQFTSFGYHFVVVFVAGFFSLFFLLGLIGMYETLSYVSLFMMIIVTNKKNLKTLLLASAYMRVISIISTI